MDVLKNIFKGRLKMCSKDQTWIVSKIFLKDKIWIFKIIFKGLNKDLSRGLFLKYFLQETWIFF